jgi:hypothetical protein
MKRIIFYSFFIASLATGCGKEISVETNGGGTGTGTGTGPGTGGGSTDPGTYQPFSKNSYWKYRQTGTLAGEQTITSTGQNRTVNGILCGVFNSTSTLTPGTTEGFFGVKDHNYYTVLKGASPNTGAIIDVNFLYLNDTASVGYTWGNAAGTGNGFKAFTPGEIIEKGITITVEGKSYKDVTHTRVDLQYEIPGFGVFTFATYDYYVAKNIGIIKVDTKGDDMWASGLASEMNLIEYSIK